MRGAWGKPYGTAARVNIGQIILSIRCKDANAPVVQEALRRARYKFPGRQKIIVSRKWGFTNVNREDYTKLKEEKRVLQYVPFAPLLQLADLGFAGMVPMSNTSARGVISRRTFAHNFVHELVRSSLGMYYPCCLMNTIWVLELAEYKVRELPYYSLRCPCSVDTG